MKNFIDITKKIEPMIDLFFEEPSLHTVIKILLYPTPITNHRKCANFYTMCADTPAIIGLKHEVTSIWKNGPQYSLRKGLRRETTSSKTTHLCHNCFKYRYPVLYGRLIKIILRMAEQNKELMTVLTFQQIQGKLQYINWKEKAEE